MAAYYAYTQELVLKAKLCQGSRKIAKDFGFGFGSVSCGHFTFFLFNCIRRCIAHPRCIASLTSTMQLWVYVAFVGLTCFLARGFGPQPQTPCVPRHSFSLDCLCTPFRHHTSHSTPSFYPLSPLTGTHFCNQIGTRPVELSAPSPFSRSAVWSHPARRLAKQSHPDPRDWCYCPSPRVLTLLANRSFLSLGACYNVLCCLEKRSRQIYPITKHIPLWRAAIPRLVMCLIDKQ